MFAGQKNPSWLGSEEFLVSGVTGSVFIAEKTWGFGDKTTTNIPAIQLCYETKAFILSSLEKNQPSLQNKNVFEW